MGRMGDISKSEILLCTVGSESIPCSAAKVCPLGHAQQVIAISAPFEYLCYGSTASLIFNYFIAGIDIRRQNLLSRHNTLNPCWFNFGPPSTTLDQCQTTIESTSCV